MVLSGRAPGWVSRWGRPDGGTARTAEQGAPHVGETGRERGEELAERVEGPVVHQHGLDLGDRAGPDSWLQAT